MRHDRLGVTTATAQPHACCCRMTHCKTGNERAVGGDQPSLLILRARYSLDECGNPEKKVLGWARRRTSWSLQLSSPPKSQKRRTSPPHVTPLIRSTPTGGTLAPEEAWTRSEKNLLPHPRWVGFRRPPATSGAKCKRGARPSARSSPIKAPPAGRVERAPEQKEPGRTPSGGPCLSPWAPGWPPWHLPPAQLLQLQQQTLLGPRGSPLPPPLPPTPHREEAEECSLGST